MSEAFVGAIDLAYRKEGYDDRSKFVRAAVKEKLEKLGYKIPVEDAIAPGRTKGKPRK
jgi:Arc/MetJ-type ribon-helix-helix transcriptional regulator